MKPLPKTIGILLMLGGVGIIIAAFYLFLAQIQAENLFYLNLIVTIWVFVLAYCNIFDLFGSVSSIARSSSSFGLIWIALGIYLPASVAMVVLSIVLHLSFSLCLIIHLSGLLVFSTAMLLAFVTARGVNNAMEKEEHRKQGQYSIESAIAILEADCTTGRLSECLPLVQSLKQECRFITPSSSQAAQALDAKIVAQIESAARILQKPSSTPESFKAEIDRCITLVGLRKKQY